MKTKLFTQNFFIYSYRPDKIYITFTKAYHNCPKPQVFAQQKFLQGFCIYPKLLLLCNYLLDIYTNT